MGKSSRRENRRNRKERTAITVIGRDKPREDIFTGETMACVMCGAQEQSDPDVQSNWRAIEWNEFTYYVCPQELPPDGASQAEFKAAYVRVLQKIGETYARQKATQVFSPFAPN